MKEVFTARHLAQWAAISFLIAQAVVWMLEVRAGGFREWLRANISQSYLGYLASRSHSERFRLAAFGLIVFAGCVAISLLS